MRTPTRQDGYAPIQDYAVIGNKRTGALIALDGSVDWLCLPRFDSPSVFGALLDPALGGSFELRPEAPFEVGRRYLPDTNILETTFVTDDGVVRVTDAMSIPQPRPVAWNELVRRVDGIKGSVAMRWAMRPRFAFKGELGVATRHGDALIVRHDELGLALLGWDAGEIEEEDGGAHGRFTVQKGDTATLALVNCSDKPLLLPERDAIARRMKDTADYWKEWSGDVKYDGDWRDAVVRSILALELLTHEPDGSMIAALTTSLPERIGGDRNYDYRYAWTRDTTFVLDALLRLGYPDAVHSTLAWLLHTARRTHPRVHTFYGLDGRVHDEGSTALGDWSGYRGSKPVRIGNDAGRQLQLGNFGDLMHTTWLFVRDNNVLDPATAQQLADTADLLCDLWRNPDSAIWEVDEQRDYTQGKMSAWLAFRRAIQLAEAGQLPTEHVERWRSECEAMREFIQTECVDHDRDVWVRYPGTKELDAAVLLVAGMDFVERDDTRLANTIDAIRDELSRGPLLYRYSGMESEEGCFLACSYWLVEALARTNRIDAARELMDELVPLSNDVGLYSEEMDPASGDMLGNFPQALTHLSLINAAFALEEAGVRESHGEF